MKLSTVLLLLLPLLTTAAPWDHDGHDGHGGHHDQTTPTPTPCPGGTCPQCAPLPGENFCDITTSCVYVWGHTDPNTAAPYYCACRAGYRGDNVAPGDTSQQWRLNWFGPPSQQGRVFVRPGIACNTLCDHWELGKDGCQEVAVMDQCL
ncbi:hypothetical protein K432DRAFT_381945 [Lepidopterella palustris CBS 459.81]|uniref:Uncharacterized protein n=1 Tax=Lepidopterella palustris CBS 459.81 TaxID=1314670 RepID=A0A8E2EB46_9PEZI|nr:hypothetical protein K432DRAFT_381945 [Lepidopterella palustris CBS 459.81]